MKKHVCKKNNILLGKPQAHSTRQFEMNHEDHLELKNVMADFFL